MCFFQFEVHCPAFIILQLHKKKKPKQKQQKKTKQAKKNTSTLFFSSSSFTDSTFMGLMSLWEVALSLKSQLFIFSVFIAFTFITCIEKRHQHTHKKEKGIASPSLSLIFWASAGLPSSAVTVPEVKCTIKKAQEWELQNTKKKY